MKLHQFNLINAKQRGFDIRNLLLGACLLAGVVGVCGQGKAHAKQNDSKMDIATHTTVIAKIESALSHLSGAPQTYQMHRRLADLYSERARLLDIELKEKEAQQDRRAALAYYEKAQPHAPQELQGALVLQRAHLHERLSDPATARKLYSRIIATKSLHQGMNVGMSLTALGEMDFRLGKFSSARKHYAQAQRHPHPQPAYVSYRLAWCDLNEGKFKSAENKLFQILESKQLEDQSFRLDILKDVASLMARTPLTEGKIKRFMTATPPDHQKEMAFHLAREVDRLSHKESNAQAWSYIGQAFDLSDPERLEVLSRLTQTQLDRGMSQAAMTLYQQVLSHYENTSCRSRDTECEAGKVDSHQRLRRFVINWNTTQKHSPPPALLEAYKLYLKTFPGDLEMLTWAAQLADRLKDHASAMQFYLQAAEVAHNTDQNQALEGSLVGAMTVAERGNDLSSREKAYSTYLRLHPNGSRAFQVRYQRAQTLYEMGQIDKSLPELLWITEQKANQHIDEKLQIQAANLILDSYALLKQDELIEKYAQIFATKFPHQRETYRKLHRNSLLRQSAHLILQDTAQSHAQALAKLNMIHFASASRDEQVGILKNQILAAKKLRDVATVEKASTRLSQLKGASLTDKEYGYSHLVWVHEIRLDFQSALRVFKKIKLKRSDLNSRLQLIALTELAGLNPTFEINSVLQDFKPNRMSRSVRAELIGKKILHSRNVLQSFQDHLSTLKKSPELLHAIALEVFARTHTNPKSRNYFTSFIRNRSNGSAHTVIERHLRIAEAQEKFLNWKALPIHTMSDKKLQTSLKSKINALAKLEKELTSPLFQNDFTVQIVALSQLEGAYLEMHRRILQLPTPKGLTPKLRMQYQEALKQKSLPFVDSAVRFRQTRDAHFNTQNHLFAKVSSLILDSTPALRRLYAHEMSVLVTVAPKSLRPSLEHIISLARIRSNNKAWGQTRSEVAKSPFSEALLKRLRELEAERGELLMASYLDRRIETLKKESL